MAVQVFAQDDGPSPALSYNRDIRPILAETCFACHGPDSTKRKAGLALHERERALARLGSGDVAIVPGHASASELVRRIIDADPDAQMPPPSSGKHLTPQQIQILIQWIAAGAPYQQHWAYVPPVAPAVPIRRDPWVANAVDAFVLKRLEENRLRPSPPTEAITLIRRLSFDLTGLPPTPEQVDAFVADGSEANYQRTVERLLASPQYGERMAVSWLDLVRYADSIGYHSDNPRNVTPYRDWVIKAFNADMPFDEFTREQLAGDLVPAANLQQLVASGYNRLTMTTEEGGAQAKEYESKSAADRVRNLSGAWLGSTMQCCECHDHKFDPFTQHDFYSMEAFFADIQEAAIGPREAGVSVPTIEQQAQLDGIDRQISSVEAVLAADSPQLAIAQAHWEASLVMHRPPTLGAWYHLGPFLAATSHAAFTTAYDPETTVDLATARSDHLHWILESDWRDGEIHHFSGDNSATYLYRTLDCVDAQGLHLSLGSDDTITVWLDSHLALSHEVSRGVAADQEQLDLALTPGHHQLLLKICNGGGDYAYYFKASGEIPAEVSANLAIPPAARTATQAGNVAAYFHSIAPQLQPSRIQLADLHTRHDALLAQIPKCLVTQGGPPRIIKVKARGNWMDEGGEVCQPAVPHFLAQLNVPGRASRLDLANWLVSGNNPLVSRVLVNRLWKQCFGTALVKTLGDFGTQGDAPSNPELLDFLAEDLSSHGWSLKRTLRLLVSSHAYRQSSHGGALLERDPDNRLVARQSCFRLDAEFVRDDALAISGLLVLSIGGPSVRPYQPAGYLMHLNFPPREWIDDHGDDEYRRGLYTFWQRSFLHPSLLAFDAPSREECICERPRSNTPQQALVLLNDPTFVEAARAFAEHIMRDGGTSDDQRLRWAFRQALSRPPVTQEISALADFLAAQRAAYLAHPLDAETLLTVGYHQPSSQQDHRELAVWTAVGRLVLNLHETITRN